MLPVRLPLDPVLGDADLLQAREHAFHEARGGLLAGLATLSRNDGLLVLAALGIAFLWDRWRQRAIPWSAAFACLGLFILVMAPWWLRQLAVFGSFTFYLPELFPPRLRGTGSGFTYNVGRIVTAGFPFVVGQLAQTTDPLIVMGYVAIAPLVGVALVLSGVAIETKDGAEPSAST